MFRSLCALTARLARSRKDFRDKPRLPRPMQHNRPLLERLEDRLAPASLNQTGPTLTITLNNANEQLTLAAGASGAISLSSTNTFSGSVNSPATFTGFGATSGTLTPTGITTIDVKDTSGTPGAGVVFAGSTNIYTETFNVALIDSESGNITFADANQFSASLSATTAGGTVLSSAGASFTVGANLILAAGSGHTLQLLGPVNVTGTTSLSGNDVQAANAHNTFTGAVSLNATGTVDLFANGPLILGASNFMPSAPGLQSQITAAGSITQSGGITNGAGSGLETVAFTSTGGNITLTSAGNIFDTGSNSSLAIGLNVTGSNNASLSNASQIILAGVTTGTGALTVTAQGSISQTAGTVITTGGSATFNISNKTGSVSLDNGANNFVGPVTIAETGGTLQNVSFRNVNTSAGLPTITQTGSHHVANYTVQLDNVAVTLPALTITGTLTVIANGPITQSAGLTVGAGATFEVLGNQTINLQNTTNAIFGPVAFDSQQSSQAVGYTNNGPIQLGASDLGRGALSITALSGNITTAALGAIVQEQGADTATFTAKTGTTLSLNGANDFTGGVFLVGTNVTTVSFDNNDPLAKLANVTIPTSMTSFTVAFPNAAVVLPTLPLTTLNVTGDGIFQLTPAADILNITGQATFNGEGGPIQLNNPGNAFTNITLSNTTTQSSGRNDVSINDTGALTFTGTSNLGPGAFTVTAGGTISESSGAFITQNNPTGITQNNPTGFSAGPVALNTTSGNISLGQDNTFSGTVSLSDTFSGGTVTVNNSQDLTLGNVTTTGTGTFTVTAGGTNASGNITQAPATTLNLAGTSSFATVGSLDITLANAGNVFTGAVSLNGGPTVLQDSIALVLAASNLGGSSLTVTAGGTITQTGAITAGTASFTASSTASSDITLSNGWNHVATLNLTEQGFSYVTLTDSGALVLGVIQLGSGTFSVTTTGNVTESTSGALTQIGAGAITITTGSSHSISLFNSANNLLGSVTVTASTGVDLSTQGNLTFAPTSAITGLLQVNAGGALTLPSHLTSLTGLTVTAKSTMVSSNITTAGGGINFTGAVDFTTAVTLTGTTAFFSGDVSVNGALTFSLASFGSVFIEQGTWSQGSNNLTINGSGPGFLIAPGATLAMTGGTISMPGQGEMDVNGTFAIGTPIGSAQIVTLSNGGGSLVFGTGSTLEVALGGAELIKDGDGNVVLSSPTGTGAAFVGAGLATAGATPILVAPQGASILGTFAGSVDTSGNPTPFFAGSDIVMASYTAKQVSIGAAGTVSPGGTFTGITPGGDKITVTSSLGSAAGLVVVRQADGGFGVVLRNNSATTANTLTLTTTPAGGPGVSQLDGIADHTPGAVTITAAGSNLTGSVETAGTLSALKVRNIDSLTGGPLQITDGANGPTTIAARVVTDAEASLLGTLTSLTAISVTGSSITANRFGTIKSTGSAAAGNAGNFTNDTLVSLATTGTVVLSARIAGELSGIWDVGGNVGTVTAGSTGDSSSSWTLGPAAGANVHNGGLLDNIASLSLGQVSELNITASGALAALTAVSINSAFGSNLPSVIQAASVGTFQITGSTALGDVGDVSNLTLTLTGNAGGSTALALGMLSVAGDLSSADITADNGNLGVLSVGRQLSSSTITAAAASKSGGIGAIIAGDVNGLTIGAKALGTLKTTGTLAAGLFGDVVGSSVTLSGNGGGKTLVTLGTFSASGNVDSSTFEIPDGNVTSFTVAQQIQGSTIDLSGGTTGNLGVISAGDWQSTDLTARTVGSLSVTGVSTAFARTGGLAGDMTTSTIDVFGSSGNAASLGTFRVAGNLNSDLVDAPQGIGAFAVHRGISISEIVADAFMAKAPAVGRIATLTAGSIQYSTLTVGTMGTVRVTGFTTPNASGGNIFTPGSIANSAILAKAGLLTTTVAGIGSLSVQDGADNSMLTALFGITALTIGGELTGTTIVTDNPIVPSAGTIGTLSAGDIGFGSAVIVRAGTIGTFAAIGSAALDLLGSIDNTQISVDNSSTKVPALTLLSAAGDFFDNSLDVPGSVMTFHVGGTVSQANDTSLAAGYASGAHIGSIRAGAWQDDNLTAFSVSSFKVTGNAARSIVGNVLGSFFDLIGNVAGVGLGTFSATGNVHGSTFEVENGNVTSFIVSRFLDSNLLVGVTMPVPGDITLGTPSWSSTNRSIGTFETTATFNSSDVTDTASFGDSTVVAAVLGTVNLSGVAPTINPLDALDFAFGLGFRTSAGATAKGKVSIGNQTGTLTTGFNLDQFHYLGLPG